MSQSPSLSWNSYSQKYDMLLAYNPYYQELQQLVFEKIRNWNLSAGEKVADLGAGTGNYSVYLAETFPEATIYHIDKHQGMNDRAKQKRDAKGLKNLFTMTQGIEETEFAPGSLNAVLSVHALYTFPDPRQTLKDIFHWLAPGGEAILVNAGRRVNVLDWQIALSTHLVKNYGLKKTWQIFREGKEVSRQNAYIRKLQKDGTFWTHTHEEFCEAVRKAGFVIEDTGVAFRGISDWVVAKKM